MARLSIGVFCAFAAMNLAQPAAAQGLGQETERGATVLARPRPLYDPVGVRLGAFRLDAAGTAGIGWDSNPFGRSSQVASDGFTDQSATAALNSGWSRHAIGLTGGMTSRQYFSKGVLDWTDWNIGALGRYDVSAYTSVEGAYQHLRQHLDTFSLDVQRAGILKPVPYDSDEVRITGNTRFNRLGLRVSGTYRTYRYEDAADAAARPAQVTLQDYDSLIGNVETSYMLSPGRSAIATLRVQDNRYLSSTIGSDPLTGRDSLTWTMLGGFAYDFDGVWQGRLSVGWQQRSFTGSGLKALNGPAVDGSLTWAPTRLTTVRLNVGSTIEESIQQDAAGYRRYYGSAAIDHEWRRNVILSGEVRIDSRNYVQPSAGATDATFTAGATWILNRSLTVIGAYSYSHRLQASGGVAGYDRNLLWVRLRWSL